MDDSIYALNNNNKANACDMIVGITENEKIFHLFFEKNTIANTPILVKVTGGGAQLTGGGSSVTGGEKEEGALLDDEETKHVLNC